MAFSVSGVSDGPSPCSLEQDVRRTAFELEAGNVAPRANWKGFLKVAEVTCPVALYTAVSTSERIAFHTLNRATGHRIRRQFIDSETGKPVDREDQVRGYEIGTDEYVVLEPDEVASAVPDSDKTLSTMAFIGCGDIDDVYFDRPYYLAPDGRHASEAYALIREGMRALQVAALAQTVLFRRVRTLLVRVHGPGLMAITLNFDYEVRSSKEAFSDIPDMKIKGEMLELAEHIIRTKKGKFEPSEYDDRYEASLADLVQAKLEGKAIKVSKAPKREKVVDLMAALRQSAGAETKRPAKRSPGTSKATGVAKKGTTVARRKAS